VPKIQLRKKKANNKSKSGVFKSIDATGISDPNGSIASYPKIYSK